MFKLLLRSSILTDGVQEFLNLLVKYLHIGTFNLQEEFKRHVFSLFDPAEDGWNYETHDNYGNDWVYNRHLGLVRYPQSMIASFYPVLSWDYLAKASQCPLPPTIQEVD